jgi:hypothetical protein
MALPTPIGSVREAVDDDGFVGEVSDLESITFKAKSTFSRQNRDKMANPNDKDPSFRMLQLLASN